MINDKTTGPLVGARIEHHKVKKNNSNYWRRTPTLQSRRKKKKTTSNKPTSKHECAQMHLKDLKLANLNQTTTSINRRINEPTNKKQPLNR
jgi:hypothetical protein